MKDMNQALLAKAAWRVFQDDGGIWVKILKHKYLNTKSLSDPELSKWVVCSSTWRAIYFGADLLNKGVLKDLALVNLSVGMLSQVVSDFLVDGQWLIDQLVVVLPWGVVHRIPSIHADRNSSGSDRAIWGWSKNGEFSVKTAYDGCLNTDRNAVWNWKFIWKLHLPPRVQYFLWLVMHEKIFTNSQRAARGMDSDGFCPRCEVAIEDTDHLLRGCSFL
ncbi:hypothetical protein Dsin_018943 [Dipteronia sinensis]|uniref:Reverse transcriptase zinc-binding domain-containing protein n=1 Tax=Dipteronia sinensis TaxID=43782 RepID=A0AAE0E215_9ROSI|nr:hypothetical protein Dsin_018943 [Dipteronia sinensis]